MSRADVICSGSCQPFGFLKWLCVMPSPCAVRFISATKASTLPPTPSAKVTARSFADFTIKIFSALSTVMIVLTGKPILLGGSACARAV